MVELILWSWATADRTHIFKMEHNILGITIPLPPLLNCQAVLRRSSISWTWTQHEELYSSLPILVPKTLPILPVLLFLTVVLTWCIIWSILNNLTTVPGNIGCKNFFIGLVQCNLGSDSGDLITLGSCWLKPGCWYWLLVYHKHTISISVSILASDLDAREQLLEVHQEASTCSTSLPATLDWLQMRRLQCRVWTSL